MQWKHKVLTMSHIIMGSNKIKLNSMFVWGDSNIINNVVFSYM